MLYFSALYSMQSEFEKLLQLTNPDIQENKYLNSEIRIDFSFRIAVRAQWTVDENKKTVEVTEQSQ